MILERAKGRVRTRARTDIGDGRDLFCVVMGIALFVESAITIVVANLIHPA